MRDDYPQTEQSIAAAKEAQQAERALIYRMTGIRVNDSGTIQREEKKEQAWTRN